VIRLEENVFLYPGAPKLMLGPDFDTASRITLPKDLDLTNLNPIRAVPSNAVYATES
jgi:hypothetical protein